MLAWCKSVVSHGGFGPKPQPEVARRSRRSAPVGGHNVANPPVKSGGVSSYEKRLLHTSVVRSAPFLPVNMILYHEPRETVVWMLNTVSRAPACSARRLSLVECSDQCTLVLAVTLSLSTMYSAQLILRSVDSSSPKPCAGNERSQLSVCLGFGWAGDNQGLKRGAAHRAGPAPFHVVAPRLKPADVRADESGWADEAAWRARRQVGGYRRGRVVH